MTKQRDRTESLALVALFAGATATGTSGILVRLSETGPTATAFWRGCLALPVLAIWALLERRGTQASHPGNSSGRVSSFREPRFWWAGVSFAGDLMLWNSSLLLTSVAASTLEANLAPLVVALIAWLRWGERPTLGFTVATGLALVGMLLIVSPKFGSGGTAFLGDALGLGAAVFFACYILAVARLRARYRTGIVMFNSTLVFTLLLLPFALWQKFLPDTLTGWAVLAGCAAAAQVFGQGLIAYALAHLPASFSSLGLLVQTLGAALGAWLLLGERLSAVQIVGGFVILGAITLARSARKPATSQKEPPDANSLGVFGD
jgi:drug/metabolite transporter (DMT)-like permease